MPSFCKNIRIDLSRNIEKLSNFFPEVSDEISIFRSFFFQAGTYQLH